MSCEKASNETLIKELLNSFILGEMTEIIEMTDDLACWKSSMPSSPDESWTSYKKDILLLLDKWDKTNGINWFWKAVFLDGTSKRSYVFVPYEKAKELYDYYIKED